MLLFLTYFQHTIAFSKVYNYAIKGRSCAGYRQAKIFIVTNNVSPICCVVLHIECVVNNAYSIDYLIGSFEI